MRLLPFVNDLLRQVDGAARPRIHAGKCSLLPPLVSLTVPTSSSALQFMHPLPTHFVPAYLPCHTPFLGRSSHAPSPASTSFAVYRPVHLLSSAVITQGVCLPLKNFYINNLNGFPPGALSPTPRQNLPARRAPRVQLN